MWPVKIEHLRRIQIEVTNYCNAACPSCERNQNREQFSSPYYSGINSKHISLDNIVEWFNECNFPNHEQFHLCGNVDEPTLNPEILQISEYLSGIGKTYISSNGGTRNPEFWSQLANTGVEVVFGIDGLEDTNHIYRKRVRWNKLKNNYRSFIDAGGVAQWQFIVFDHNKHQLSEARRRSKKEGFNTFKIVESNRENTEVRAVKLRSIKPETTITCASIKDDWIYITANGLVFPCCWMGTAMMQKNLFDTIGHKYGGPVSNSLHINTLEEILNSDFFADIKANFDNIIVCNEKCKTNHKEFYEFVQLK